MSDIIKWCNENEGFLTAILSLATVFVSILAIIISICTARLPYKKKLLVTVGHYFGVGIDSDGIYVTATNIGNRNINISNIGLFSNKQVLINKNTISNSQITLSVGESTSQYFEYNEINKFKKINNKLKIYGYIKDSEGKVYKKYFCRINKIQ